MAVNRLPARGMRLLPGALAAVVVLAVVRCVSDMAFAALGSSRQALSLRTHGHGLQSRITLRAEDAPMRDSEGRKIKTPRTFDASDASQVVATHKAEFKKRPFGVLAYAPSTTGKGAYILEMNEKTRYPGDAQGQAWLAGLKKGYAIKSVQGKDVSTWDFWDIMDSLNDKILDNSAGKFQAIGQGSMGNQPLELPITVEFAEIKESVGGAKEKEDDSVITLGRDARYKDDKRFADLPPDATLVEYKIPKASGPITSAVVEEMRSYAAKLPEPDAGYKGVRYTGQKSLDQQFVSAMLAQFVDGKLIPLKDAYHLAIDAFDILAKEKTLGHVPVAEGKQVTVVGDLHGQLYDFNHMLGLTGFPSENNRFVFNGDFVDRGPWSVEVMFTLLALKVWQPGNVYMNRGNHEAEMANYFYGFFGEVAVKYEKKMCELFGELFRATPLCHVLNNEVFVVHGGIPGPDPRVWWKGIDNQISFDGRQLQISLEEIENSDRFMEPNPAVNPLMVDLLWSDPKGKDGYGPSGRMKSGIYLFGPDVSKNFMQFNGLKMTLRSHEVKSQGYRYDHEGEYPLITVFSAPNYVDKAGNRAAVAVLTKKDGKLERPEFLQFDAQPHPDIPSGAYAVGGILHPDGVVNA